MSILSRPAIRKSASPPGLNALKGAELEDQYKATLEKLGKQGGLLGQIFKQGTNKISNDAILYRVVQMIDIENLQSAMDSFNELMPALKKIILNKMDRDYFL